MAGILANSVSVTQLSASADASVSGYVTAEQIVLSTTPTGASYAWALGKPSGATARSDLTDDTGASVAFTPDVAGYYVVTCTVGSSTIYVARISVTQSAAATSVEALRLQPKSNASVPTPSTGVALFYSSDESALCVKDASGDVFTVDLTAV